MILGRFCAASKLIGVGEVSPPCSSMSSRVSFLVALSLFFTLPSALSAAGDSADSSVSTDGSKMTMSSLSS